MNGGTLLVQWFESASRGPMLDSPRGGTHDAGHGKTDRLTPMNGRYRLYICLILLASVLFAGSAGFHVLESWTWFDAFYMTLMTMTTIGYGEIHPLSHAGRVFNTFVIVFAVLAGGFTIATFSQALLEFEFAKTFGRRRMERALAKLSDHYIVCGAGRVGRTVARELRARGQSVVFIEKEPQRAEWAVTEGIPVIVGNASSEETLKHARIDVAKGLVAAVNSDPENLYIVLTVRGCRSDLKIIARASEEEAIAKLLRAGASQVLSPYHFVGSRIAQLLLRPNVLDFIDAAFGTERLDVEIGEVHIESESALVGKSLADSTIRQQTGVIILGVKPADGALLFNPSPETVIRASDTLIVIGADSHLKKLEALASAAA
jgi:voltage-gated potassium channel